jgi:hypothetical protein
MSPEQIKSKLPPPLTGPRIEADTPHIRTELQCVCGAPLECVTYIYAGVVKHVVHPCPCYRGGK